MSEFIQSVLKKHWNELLSDSQEMTFTSGQVLFYEGHYPYGLFVLVSGEVAFTKNNVPCRKSHVWKSPKGDVIGLESFLSEDPSCCTSTALRDSTVVFIPKSRLLPYLEKN